MVASASADKSVRLWDPASGRCLAAFEGHTDTVLAVAFSPDGTVLASTGWDMTVRLWDPATGRCVGVLEGHTGWVLDVDFHPAGTLLATASQSCIVRFWKGDREPRPRPTGGEESE